MAAHGIAHLPRVLVPAGNTAQPTWLDIRLFHTLVRFDPVYVVYFKTNAKVRLHPNLALALALAQP